MYVQVSKTLYSMLRAALLFYRKLRSDLADMGFEMNSHDPCVANCMVDRFQCTVVWHIDNLKVSHKEEVVVTYFAEELAERNQNTITIKRGKVFTYLGMDLDFESDPGTLIILMIRYLDQVIKE